MLMLALSNYREKYLIVKGRITFIGHEGRRAVVILAGRGDNQKLFQYYASLLILYDMILVIIFNKYKTLPLKD